VIGGGGTCGVDSLTKKLRKNDSIYCEPYDELLFLNL